MTSKFHELGCPFNPTSDEFNFDFPSNVRLTGVLKKIVRGNTRMLAKQDLLQGFDDICYHAGIPHDDIHEIRGGVYRAINSIPNYNKNKGRLYSLIMSEEVMSKYREEMFNRSGSMYDKFACIVFDLYERILSSRGMQSADVNEKYKAQLFKNERRLGSGAFVISDLLLNESSGDFGFDGEDTRGNIVQVILSAAYEKEFQNDVVLAIWGISFIMDVPVAFAVFYDLWSDLFSKEKYPFLNFFVLKAVIGEVKSLGSDDESLIKSYDEDEYLMSFFLTKTQFDINRSRELNKPSSELLLSLRHDFNTVPMMPHAGHAIDSLDNAVSEFFVSHQKTVEQIAHILGMDKAELPKSVEAPEKISVSLLSKASDFSAFNGVLGRLFELKTSAKHIIAAFDECVSADDSEGKNIQQLIQILTANHEKLLAVQSEAKVLGDDPIKNFNDIKVLFDQAEILAQEVGELKGILFTVINETLDAILALRDDAFGLIESALADVDEQQDVVSKDRFLFVDGELSDALSREKDLMVQIEKLKASQLEVGAVAAKSDISKELSTIAKVALGCSTVKTVMSLIMDIHGERVVVSSKAKKSIREFGLFKHIERLFESLDKLASKEFIDAYMSGGSVKAFSFFTKKELSFQESKSTKSKCNREFTFPDKKVLDCRAHIRIGVDNTEQNMLRVYFAIENGVLYIGEVARHLPTQSDM